MNKLRKRLIHLSRCRKMTRREIWHLLQHDHSLKKVYEMTASQLSQHTSLTLSHAKNLYHDLHSSELWMETISIMRNYHTITILDEIYPEMLKKIQDPPIVLYGLGNLQLLNNQPTLSVVGSRNPSKYAQDKVKLIVEPLIRRNWLIVSGMAIGIDSFAHWSALQNYGKTIAVLGGGFHHIYPKKNLHLYHKIIERNLVLTEYEPNMAPARYHFPERNRIISGLSFGTLVVEATEKSGTLITVDQALDQGREVYAVPGSLFVKQTKGCHLLIQEGAKLVMNANDILEDWNQIKNFSAMQVEEHTVYLTNE